MLDFSQNSCYLTTIRPSIKSVHRRTTGTCQIQRVCFERNHKSLQYSIKHSKMLENYKKLYPFNNSFNNNECNYLFEIKKIKNENSKFYITQTLKQLHCTLYSQNYIKKLKQQKYSCSNKKHEQMLLQIWKNLRPQQELISRCTNQWINIGFQGSDPSTDFRGVGVLGLLNLYLFSKKLSCIKLYNISCQSKSQYFFCSAGLFITMICFNLLQFKNICYQYWIYNHQQQIVNNFQNVYQMVFKQFNKYWIDYCQNKSIIFFNQNLKNFQKKVLTWDQKLIKQLIFDSKQ